MQAQHPANPPGRPAVRFVHHPASMLGAAPLPCPAPPVAPASAPALPSSQASSPADLLPPRMLRRARRTRRATLIAGNRVGVWRVDGELGRGGMGSVYAVTHHGFGKRAALKLCHAQILSETFTPETFLREARVVHLVDHPGACDVFATGTYAGRPYLVMERLTGETLGQRLDRGAVTREEGLEILAEVCDVLGAAHAAGVTHRDLKLDNVFLLETPGAAGRRTKVLDWGVARIAGEPDPMKGMVAGTLTYVAPEQVRGEDLGTAADVYSLAVLAYQILLGGAPFASKNELELLRMHLRTEPPTPESRWPEIPAVLARTLTAMLSKSAADRPPIDGVRRAIEEAREELRAQARRSRGLWRRMFGWLGLIGAGASVLV